PAQFWVFSLQIRIKQFLLLAMRALAVKKENNILAAGMICLFGEMSFSSVDTDAKQTEGEDEILLERIAEDFLEPRRQRKKRRLCHGGTSLNATCFFPDSYGCIILLAIRPVKKMGLFLFWPFSAGGELNIACKRVFPQG
uniref:hypothetical protein n=1 Tax=Candidatus Electronema sp. TaxID=2698783 RepID=UPI004057C218